MKVKSENEDAQSLSRIRLLATPWTAAYQARPSMGFSRQEYWLTHKTNHHTYKSNFQGLIQVLQGLKLVNIWGN